MHGLKKVTEYRQNCQVTAQMKSDTNTDKRVGEIKYEKQDEFIILLYITNYFEVLGAWAHCVIFCPLEYIMK